MVLRRFLDPIPLQYWMLPVMRLGIHLQWLKSASRYEGKRLLRASIRPVWNESGQE